LCGGTYSYGGTAAGTTFNYSTPAISGAANFSAGNSVRFGCYIYSSVAPASAYTCVTSWVCN
jgi:hypothetical protein